MAITAAIGKKLTMRNGTLTITANEAIETGDLVTAGGYLADGDNSRYADFIACQDAASGAAMQVAREAVIEGFSGGAGAGTQLFLSDTAGDVSESVGTVPQLVGVELSATSAFLCPSWTSELGRIPDNVRLYFGTDLDNYIVFDGTNLTIVGDVAITGDFSASGHVDTMVFMCNAFNPVYTNVYWLSCIQGIYCDAYSSNQKLWMPLGFLKIGDEIVSYKLVGDMINVSGSPTLDCKLVKVTKADPVSTATVGGGAMAQITADGAFDVETTLTAVETVATDTMYQFEIQGTTSGASNYIYLMGAEVTINRKV